METGRNAWCLRTVNKGSVSASPVCQMFRLEKSDPPMLNGIGMATSSTDQLRILLASPRGGLRIESTPTGIRYT